MLILISINFIISGYSIGFDAHGIFKLSDGNGFGKKCDNIWCWYAFIGTYW